MGCLLSCLRETRDYEEAVLEDDSTDRRFYFNATGNSELGSLTHTAKPISSLWALESQSSDEDVCPTCFEGYTDENPKIIAKCNHHYHLGCIYNWKERSETCPACRQELIF